MILMPVTFCSLWEDDPLDTLDPPDPPDPLDPGRNTTAAITPAATTMAIKINGSLDFEEVVCCDPDRLSASEMREVSPAPPA